MVNKAWMRTEVDGTFLVPVSPVLFKKKITVQGYYYFSFFGGTRYFLIMNQCENSNHNA